MSIKRYLAAGAFVIAVGAIATGAEATGPNAPHGYNANMNPGQAAASVSQGSSATTYQIKPSYPQTTYNKHDVAICPASIQAADRKELPKATPFAEQIFSRIACGKFDSVAAMFTLAHKADPIDLLQGPKKEAFVMCMENSIPKSMSVTTHDGVKVEPVDLKVLDKEERAILIGTLAHACKQQLKM